jgi:hypothetical protein
MEEDRMPKKIFTQELEGTRRRGRPRKRWKEEVERDFRVLGVRRWRELVTDREKMEGYCSTGCGLQATAGCSANGGGGEEEEEQQQQQQQQEEQEQEEDEEEEQEEEDEEEDDSKSPQSQ